VVNHHATRGYIAYHVGSAIKELWRNEKDTQKRLKKRMIKKMVYRIVSHQFHTQGNK